MIVTKSKIALSLFLFPALSFLIFFNWAQSIANDPSYLDAGAAVLQYVLVFGTTVGCNSPVFWILGLIIALGFVIYGMLRRNLTSYLLLNCALFAIFLIPIILAVTGTSRFCLNFLA